MQTLEKNIKGLSLLELVVVLVLIGVVTAVAYPNFNEWNRERKVRAIDLAKKLNTESQNIAGAWPLNLDFPSFALIGPRIISEIDSSLKNLDLELTREQVNWLNLKD